MSEKDKIQEAINFHKKGYLDKAEKIYLTLLDNKKLNFDILKFLSVLNYQKKNYIKAIQYIDLAINIKPDNSEIWSDNGVY